MSEEISQRLTDRKRADILAAAVQEFEATGYDNTSMNRIAEVAGVSKRTVYNHFQSKEVLFEAIVALLIENTEALPPFPYQADRPLDEQLRRHASDLVKLFASTSFQSLARVILSQFLRSPNLTKETIGDERRFRVRMVKWLEAASREGRLAVPDAQLAAAQFGGLLKEFAFWPPLLKSEPDLTEQELERMIELSVAMFLEFYAPPK